jgi:hypothetical protein
LQGTKWENYRLRGTQIDFIDSMGVPTLLGNSQIEASSRRTPPASTAMRALPSIAMQQRIRAFFLPSLDLPILICSAIRSRGNARSCNWISSGRCDVRPRPHPDAVAPAERVLGADT